MDWLTHHKTSETYAAKAHTSMAEGRSADAEKLFRRAAAAEERALQQLDPAKLRTFGITAVSAVSLWFKGRDLPRAARLAQRCLTQPDLPAHARVELAELSGAISSSAARSPSVGPCAASEASAGGFSRCAFV